MARAEACNVERAGCKLSVVAKEAQLVANLDPVPRLIVRRQRRIRP